MRSRVARIIVETMSQLGMEYPEPAADLKDRVGQIKKELDQSE
jgi:hypothetical protein